MSIERCSRCGEAVDIDTHAELIEYTTKGPVCYNCLEQDKEICLECGEYRPDGKCNCTQEVLP